MPVILNTSDFGKELTGGSYEYYTYDDLIMACSSGNLEKVRKCVECGVDIHIHKDNALKEACDYYHAEVMKYLIEQGANVNVNNSYPLHMACCCGNLELVKFLVKQYDDIGRMNFLVIENLYQWFSSPNEIFFYLVSVQNFQHILNNDRLAAFKEIRILKDWYDINKFPYHLPLNRNQLNLKKLQLGF